ncbi:DUF2797 domain-containing protein [Peredibacter starrii]|uniref:DUF2797 domain-containing protein n=1 Tax=Peredibacter starrii TaxID=28202 RepID=A0AAX4HJ56_9BACT|nr:DUF2797 domain-containing protein [Peredibacter starrii]WPU63253.1 DUF2797 domain-containing protein [Peredibacter starrii]
MKLTGTLSKMETRHDDVVSYGLQLREVRFDLNQAVGKDLRLTYSGNIICENCGKKTKKSYAEGHCYPCTMKLASCDLCILKPELCHFDKGTCREPQWGEENCFKNHIVYLANSSGLKVGITRKTQVPIRWMDQGASEALPILEVKNRFVSGQVEVLFKKHINDKTDWRKMLKGEPDSIDLKEWRDKLLKEVAEDLKHFDVTVLDQEIYKFKYPVEKYPEKVNSFNLDKTNEVTGRLMGIKGQYLIFDTGVLNVRSHTGYEITLEEIHATT